MHFLDLTLPTPAENLALDEALLHQAEKERDREVLRFWEIPHLVVILGAGCILAEDVDEPRCLADAVPILRRSSGGGTVLLGPGCLAYSLVLAYQRAPELSQIGPSYCLIFDQLIQALALPGLQCAGVSDLAVRGMKVSGNSQQRKRHHLLHHGTLLYSFDTKPIGRYLRMPARQPKYRQGRAHPAFVANLPLQREEIVARMRKVFDASRELTSWPAEEVRQLVADKYSREEWTRRR